MILDLTLLLFCGIGLLIVLSGVVVALIQLGIIFKKATEEPYRDMSSYSLDQGRDVGKSQEE